MRIAGRLLFAALVIALCTILLLVARTWIANLRHDARPAARAYGEAQPSLVYILQPQPTLFMFSRPQQRVRVLTNSELRRHAKDTHYSVIVEAISATGDVVWRRDIHARTVRLFVRRPNGKLVPHAFTPQRDGLVASAGDETLIDFAQPVVGLRLREGMRARGVASILARVQEHRPISERQLQVGWQRLTRVQQEQLSAGNPLGPALVNSEERRRLLMGRWHPVGPAGVEGRNYVQTTLYERLGALVRSTGRGA
jgi:hypothetical protein